MSSRGCGMGKVIVVCACLVSVMAPRAQAQALRLTGRGGTSDWGETPVVVEIKRPLTAGSYVLQGPGGSPIPAVVFLQDDDRPWLGAILPTLQARKPFSFDLKPQTHGSDDVAGGIRFRPSGRNLDVMLDGRLLSTYWVGTGPKPFFFPLVGPTGESFTRAFPMIRVPDEDHDHPHQRSCWFTHGRVNGIDFWSEEPARPAEEKKGTVRETGQQAEQKKGTIRETERQVVVEGPVLARLRTRDDWVSPDGHPVCRDQRTVTFYRTHDVRIIDFEVAIEAASGPVTFGDTKEGMFGLRVASSMDVDKKKGGRITNAEGVTDLKAWGKASPWVDYVGPVKGQTVGIAILNHPGSFRFPTTWHVRDYGLFAANPFGWKDFGRPDRGDYTLPAGDTLRFAYRVVLHQGDTASLGVDRFFESYSGVPGLEVRVD
jgi:hypothetical protein